MLRLKLEKFEYGQSERGYKEEKERLTCLEVVVEESERLSLLDALAIVLHYRDEARYRVLEDTPEKHWARERERQQAKEP